MGVLLSVFSALSCQFFSFENVTKEPWIGLSPPFDSTVAGNIGLFSYQITKDYNDIVGVPMQEGAMNNSANTTNTTSTNTTAPGYYVERECVSFDDKLLQLIGQDDDTISEMWIASQFCAILAIILSGLAFLVNLIELVCCNYPFSCLIPATMLFVAFGLQVGTFMILARSEFWYVLTNNVSAFANEKCGRVLSKCLILEISFDY